MDSRGTIYTNDQALLDAFPDSTSPLKKITSRMVPVAGDAQRLAGMNRAARMAYHSVVRRGGDHEMGLAAALKTMPRGGK